MAIRNIYLKIEEIANYNPVNPEPKPAPPRTGYYFLSRPAIASAPATVAHGAVFTVNTPDAPSIAEVLLMRPGAVTHRLNQTQRYVGCAFTAAAGALSVTAPPDGNVAAPGWYMLFIVNSGRVPSLAKWIRLTP